MNAMRPIYALGYVVSRGLRGMAQAPLVQLIAVATMAVCMLLLGVVVLGFTNAQHVARAWGVDVPVTVYLAEDAPAEDVDALVGQLQAVPQVEGVERITPEQAMERLAAGIGEGDDLLEGIDASVLPASLEIDLASGVQPQWTSDLADQLDELPIVDETAVAGAWAGRANEMIATLRQLALGAGILVGFACMAIVWSTIRLGVYARRAEIQILRLVGGTARFVHGPFVIEGMIQGVAGAGLALSLLWLGFDAIVPFMEQGLSMMFAAGALHFFSPLQIGIGVAFGALVGALGSRAAVARYVEA